MTSAADIPERTFYIMRHGQSTANRDNITGQSSEYMLTTKGITQAFGKSSLFESLEPKPDIVISSAMVRAIETAMMMTGMEPLPENQEPRLNEKYPEETVAEHKERVLGLIQHRMQHAPDNTLMFVAHGHTIIRLFEAFGIERPAQMPNAAVYRFDPPRQAGDSWQVSQLGLEEEKPKEYRTPTAKEETPRSAMQILSRHMKSGANVKDGAS